MPLTSAPLSALGNRWGRAPGRLVLVTVLFYALLLDIAVETFLAGAGTRWWTLGALIAYGALNALLWRRTQWPTRAAGAFLMILAIFAASAWADSGSSNGMRALGQSTSALLAGASVVALAGTAILFARMRGAPAFARWPAIGLAAYGITALVLGMVNGTQFVDLLNGSGAWSRLPRFMQGPFIGLLMLVPAAGVVYTIGLLRGGRSRSSSVQLAPAVFLAAVFAATLGAALRPGSGGAAALVAETSFPPVTGDSRSAPAGRGIIHAEVASVAAHFGADPEALLAFVSDSIRYDPYAGILRGPLGTILARAGNAGDQAVLLHELLRLASPDAEIRFALARLRPADSERVLEDEGSPKTGAARLLEPAQNRGGASARVQTSGLQWLEAALHSFDAHRRAIVDSARADVRLLTDLLRERDVTLAIPDERRGDIREIARDHIWLQIRQNGAWVDLDPTLEHARTGQRRTSPDRTVDALPDERYHHVAINVRLDERTSDGPASRYLLRTRWRSSDLVGAVITYAHVETFGQSAILEQLPPAPAGMQGYTPMLLVDDEYGLGEPVFLPAISSDADLGSGARVLGSRVGQMLGSQRADPVDSAAPTGGTATEPAALFLELVTSGPDGKAETVERAIFDRIGYAARAAGRTATTPLAPVAAAHGVHAPFVGFWNIAAWSGESPRAPTRELFEADPLDVDSRAAFDQIGWLHQQFYALRADLYRRLAGDAGWSTGTTNLSILGWFLPNLPDAAEPALIMDIARNRVRIRQESAVDSSPLLWGVASLHAERLLFALQDPADSVEIERLRAIPDVATIFNSAIRSGTPLVVLGERDIDQVESLPFTADARARLRSRLEDGLVAVVPEKLPPSNEGLGIGWWLFDERRGQVFDETEDGRHAAGRMIPQENPMMQGKSRESTFAISRTLANHPRLRRAIHAAACAITLGIALGTGIAGDVNTANDFGEAAAAACTSQTSGQSRGRPPGRRNPGSQGGSGPPGLAARSPAGAGWDDHTLHGRWPPQLQRHR